MIKRVQPLEGLVQRFLPQEEEHSYSSGSSIPSLKWGCDDEPIACQAYVEHEQRKGRKVFVKPSGLVFKQNAFLGASPDGEVWDETAGKQGLVEIKCPYSARSTTPQIASFTSNTFCSLSADGEVTLKHNHHNFYQVQGTMAVTGTVWTDFVC